MPVAIITGASSGIGEACALEFARHHWSVVLAARRADRLEALAGRCRELGAQALCVPTDVSDQSQVRALVAAALEKFGRLDVMVNNAGYGLFARVDETTDEQMRDILATNFFGVFYGSLAAIEAMKRSGGHIFNVSSVLGMRGSPYHGAYSASKHAINGMDDSMRVELRSSGIRVTTVCPALTRTEFFEHSKRGAAAESSFRAFNGMTPAPVVARKIYRAVGRNRPRIVITFGGKLLALIAAVSPRLADWMMGFYHRSLVKRIARNEEGPSGSPPGPQ